MCSKPPCRVPECEGKHAESLHEILVGPDASISPAVEEEDEEEDDAYVNMARAEGREEEDDGWWDPDDSWLEMEAEEEGEDGIFYVNALTGKEAQEEDEDGIFYVDFSPGRKGKKEEGETGGWWTLDWSWPETEEEDEEDIRYLNDIIYSKKGEQGSNDGVGDNDTPLELPGPEEEEQASSNGAVRRI
jgi:hypothetical protein